MRIARVVLALTLPWLASLAGAQVPHPEPMPKEMIAGERLQPPGLGFSIQRPGEGWEWMYLGSLEEHTFQAVNRANGQIFMVLVTPSPEPLSKKIAEGFMQGLQESAAADGTKLVDVSLSPSQTPAPGSFRYSYGVHMEDTDVYWTGYLVSAGPKGFCVIQELRQSPGESEELTKFVRSFQLVGAPAAAQATSNRYVEAGIPDASHEWTGADYERAVQILSSSKVSLPRLADPQGAALVRRMTSTGNLASYHNKDVPLPKRIEDLLKMYQNAALLMKLYYNEPTAGGGGPHQEMAAVVAFLVQGCTIAIELTDELLPTIPKDDHYETRMAGLKQMNEGITTVFVSAEQTLAERAFSADDLSVMLESMESALPRIKKAFPDEVRADLRKKLEADKARFSAPKDLQRLDAMIRELSA